MTLKKKSPLLQAFEVVLFTLLIGGIGYWVEPQDPLLLHYNFSFLILWLAIITLFYGLMMGMLMWTLFALVSFLGYQHDPIFTSVLLENLFFVFLFGFFFNGLHERLDKKQIKIRYLQQRFHELTHAFFTLKISHDKLESVYIIQPASLRFVISDILETSDHSTPEQSARNTLKILQKFFSVNSAMIYRVKQNHLDHCLASIGDIDTHGNEADKLIQESLLMKRAIYLNDLDEKEQTSYVYAVPFLDKRHQIVSMLIVKEIPFLMYHEDTLLKIDVIFTYVWTEFKKRASLEQLQEKNPEQHLLANHHESQNIIDFKLEVIRLQNILEGYGIDSRVYVISTTSERLDHEIEDFLYQNELFEILDQYIAIRCGNRYAHFILFPFISNPAIYHTAQKLNDAFDEMERQTRIEDLEENLRNHLSKESFNTLHKKQISVKNFTHLLEEYDCV